ncbi:hypothetical protein SMICM17S_00440 [Streptomyces microflavus]
MTVWDDLVGQDRVREQLAAAAKDADALVTAVSAREPVEQGSKMTHAWLFTGPPGSGGPPPHVPSPPRSSAPARTGRWAEPRLRLCDGCHTSLIGTHADVQVIRTDLLSIGVKRRPATWSAALSSPRRSAGGRSSSWRTPTASPKARATSC